MKWPFLVILVIGLFVSSARAEEDVNLLIIENPETISQQTSPAEMSEQIEIKFDPSEVITGDKPFDREDFVKKSNARMNDPIPDNQIYDFENPRTAEELQIVLQMDDKHISKFLERKAAFQGKFVKVLSFFRLSAGKINKALADINRHFYQSSHVIAHSNAKGVSLRFSLSAGLALPGKIMASLREKSIGKFIPESGGFHYLLGVGADVIRKTDESGKSKLVFELFVDAEKLKSTLTGVAKMSTSGTLGFIFENRQGPFLTQENTTRYGGATGAFTSGKSHFSWAVSTGFSLPPAVPAVLVYQDQVNRFYLFRLEGLKVSLPALGLVRDNIISAFRSLVLNKGVAVRCEQVFQ
jgi:hypothetical protein